MIPLEIALFLGGVAAILAVYSFLERESWMYSQLTASALSAGVLWILTALAASGNIGAYYIQPVRQETNGTITNITSDIITVPVLDTSLPLIISLFAIVMSVYFVLHAAVWVQERIENKEEED